MGGAPFRRRFVRASIDHFVRVMRGFFDVKVLVLTRSAFGTNQSTTVNILEITIGGLLPPFGVFAPVVVDTQMPFAVFFKSMPLDEVIFLLRRTLALPLPLAILAAAVAAGLLGLLSEVLVFRPLQRRGAHRWMGMVGSLALARILIGLAQEVFGTQVVRYPDNALAGAAFELLGVRLQLLQIVAIGAALMMMIALAVLLRYTNLGRAIRTVAFSETVARLVGVPVDRVRLARSRSNSSSRLFLAPLTSSAVGARTIARISSRYSGKAC